MSELTAMVNIGAEMARKLAAAGIHTPQQLAAEGAEGAFFRLKAVFPQVCLVHLYCLEGAVTQTEYTCPPWRGPFGAWSSTASPRTGSGS